MIKKKREKIGEREKEKKEAGCYKARIRMRTGASLQLPLCFSDFSPLHVAHLHRLLKEKHSSPIPTRHYPAFYALFSRVSYAFETRAKLMSDL